MKRAALWFGIWVVSVYVLFVSRAEAFHCGDRLVLRGDTKARVWAVCGPPTWIDHRIVYRDSTHRVHVARGQTVTERIVVPVLLEEWTYDFGRGRFVRVLLFEGSRMRTQERLRYSYGDGYPPPSYLPP